MVNDAVDPKSLKAFQLSEKEFQQQITDLADALGWTWYHTNDSRRSREGFPDLVLMRERIIYMEVKRSGEWLSQAQDDWCKRTRVAGGFFICVRPEDFEMIKELLEDPTTFGIRYSTH